jgi:ADP-dependent NAD(P)H-hydrate dehydratase / NAD(P)H-hydrate epimerase
MRAIRRSCAIPDEGAGVLAPAGLAAALALIEGKDAIALGPAIGTAPATREFVNELLSEAEVPCVVDADGLNVLDLDPLGRRPEATILTPHPGEMGRLMGMRTADVEGDRLGVAAALAKRTGALVILKGYQTVVATPDGRCAINPTGNPGMATAGMGDALTGIIASFVAQRISVREACLAAVYLHGLAGDLAAGELGEASVVATDVIGKLGEAMESVRLR